MTALLKPEQAPPYTVAEVAHRLRLSPRGVAKRCAAGTIPAYKEGRLWRIPRRIFDAWQEAKERPVRRTYTAVVRSGGSASSRTGSSTASPQGSVLSLTRAQFVARLSNPSGQNR